MPKRLIFFLFPLLLLALTFLAYLPALHAGFIWDDDAYLTNNPTLSQPDALHRIWLSPTDSPQYYPAVFTILLIEKNLFGLNPLPFHALNILLHASSAILFWLVLRRLKVPGDPLAALIFALHPVAVETVAWITELKNTLSCFLALAALLAYIPFALDPEPLVEPRQPAPRPWHLYALSLALFLLAMLSKSVACGLAPTLLLLLWWKRQRLTARDLLPLLPFFLIALLLGWFTAHLEATHVGAAGSDFSLSPWDRLLLAARAAWFYLAKDLLPIHLVFFYPRWGIDVRVWWQYLFPLALLAALLALFLTRRRIGKAPFTGAAIFLALLFPALGFINFFPMRFSFVADHFQYIALLPFAAAIAAALTRLWPTRWRTAPIAAVAATPLLLLLATRTTLTAENYHDPATLWQSVAVENQHWMALQALSGMELARASSLRAAGASPADLRPLLQQVLDLNRQVAAQRPNQGEINNNNAQAYLLLNDLPAAEREARHAVALSPNLFITHVTLARILLAKNDPAAALAEFHAAIDAEPDRPEPHADLAAFLLNHNQEAAAEPEFTRAAQLRPSAPAWTTVGDVRGLLDRLPAARDAYRSALSIDPNFPPANDGFARAAAIDPAASDADLTFAADCATRAVAAAPTARHLDTLSVIQFRFGDTSSAIATERRALALASPDERPLLQRHLDRYLTPASQPAASAPHTQP